MWLFGRGVRNSPFVHGARRFGTPVRPSRDWNTNLVRCSSCWRRLVRIGAVRLTWFMLSAFVIAIHPPVVFNMKTGFGAGEQVQHVSGSDHPRAAIRQRVPTIGGAYGIVTPLLAWRGLIERPTP